MMPTAASYEILRRINERTPSIFSEAAMISFRAPEIPQINLIHARLYSFVRRQITR